MTKTHQKQTVKDDAWIPTACLMCYNNCSIKVHRVNGVAVKIEGNPDSPQNMGKLCAKGNAGIMTLYSPYRVITPLKRTNPEKGIGVDPKWVEISWEEALDVITEKLKKVREEDPRKLCIQSFDRAFLNDFRLHVAYGSAFGTPNAFMAGAAAYFCGSNLHPASYMATAAFHSDPDLHYCNYLITIGSQHGFLVGEDAVGNATRMADRRMEGMKVVVVDPICTNAASKANEWLPIRPGTDGALALAMVNVLLNEVDIYDVDFIKKRTNGPYLIGPDNRYVRDSKTRKPLVWDLIDKKAKIYDDPEINDVALEGSYEVNGSKASPSFQLLKEHVKKYGCKEVAKITTIPAETIRRIAEEFGKAAMIGGTIVINGRTLPYRPACVYWRKGANQHKHSMLTGWAIQLLNIIVGAINVPGGMVGVSARLLPGKVNNWSFGPKADEDGMVIPEHFRVTPLPYPAREVKQPDSQVMLLELFPVAISSGPMWDLVVANPKKFKLPYEPEVLIHSWTNMIADTVDPVEAAETFKKFFQISFAFEIDETVEFADIVLPDTHYLETLNPALEQILVAAEAESEGKGLGKWCFQLRQPVVEPPPGVRSSLEVMLEVADRVGFLKDLYHMINILNRLQEPHALDLNKKYTWSEIVDIWAKSWFGPQHDLTWFKEHGFISFPKEVEETYATSLDSSRVPVYLEHYIKAGEDVKKITEEMGLNEWDVSDYQPLPDWKPCPAYEEKSTDYDLYPVNYRSVYHSMTQTMNNIWLNELSDYDPHAYYILVNGAVARKKGLKDGDIIRLQTKLGKSTKGVVKITDRVHPEVLGISGSFGGHWAKGLPTARGKGVHYNSLIAHGLERMDMISSAIDCCVKVKISQIGEVKY